MSYVIFNYIMNIFDIFKIIMNWEIYFKLENIYYFKMLNLRVVVD